MTKQFSALQIKIQASFTISVRIVEDDVEMENGLIYNSDDKEEAIERFEEFRDLYCDEFPTKCEELKKEFEKFIQYLVDN